MNTAIIFTIKNRHITSDTKSIDLIGDNMDYTAVFDLDEDLAFERIKTARFIKDDVQEERILDDNNSCQIPPELLKKGYISVGVYTDEKSTTPCFLQITRSIREIDYPVKDPEPDVYRQLLEKIEKLKGLREIELRADEKNIQWRYVGEEEWKELISFSDITVSPEEIKQAVKEYLKDNPLEETDPTVPDWAKEPQKPTYTAEEVGALPTSKLPEAIDVALAQAKASGEFNGKDGKDGAPGEKGDPGPKGDPGETTYVENPYDDTKVREDIGQLKEDIGGLDKKFGKNKLGNLIVEYKESTYLPLESEKVLTPKQADGYTAYKLYVKGVNTVNLNLGIVSTWSYFTDENNNYITDFKVSEHYNKDDGYMVMNIPKDAVSMWVTRQNPAIDLVGLATVRNITKVTVSDYQINTANFSQFLINQKYTANGNVKIVDANGFGDYVDIQSAIDDIADDSFSNQYILLVMPGVYSRISMGTKSSDRVRYLSIIGLDKSTCVIRDDSGLYENSPFNAKGYGVYKNLTFYATHNDARSSGWAEGVNSSYAMHYDFGSDVNMTFEDCYFYSEQQSAVGLGIWDNSIVKFKRCDFESKIYALESGYGAFFAHTVSHSKTDEALKKQTLWVEDCNIISHVGSRCMLISNSGNVEQENCFFTFIKNMVYNENIKNNSVFTSVNPYVYSYGNSNSELNFTA